MNNKHFFLLLLSLILFGLISCNVPNKYEEGPFLSVFPAKDRVINTWQWSYAWEDGVNQTGARADSTIEFLEDGTLKICHEGGACREGNWNLITKKTKLQLVFGNVATAYDIYMLKEKEMWIRYFGDDTTNAIIEWELVNNVE